VDGTKADESVGVNTAVNEWVPEGSVVVVDANPSLTRWERRDQVRALPGRYGPGQDLA
jgi:hypothetical protein